MDSATTTASVPNAPVLADPDAEANSDDEDEVGEITLTITAMGDGGSDLTGYELRRWYRGPWQPVNPAPAADAEDYPDSGLMPGETYYYALRAVNVMGAGPWSDVISAVATAGLPDAPEFTTLEAVNEGSIELAWTVPNDNGTDITGYELQSWLDADATTEWTTPNLLGTNPYLATEYINSGLTAGTKYYYRIRALTAGKMKRAHGLGKPRTKDSDDPTEDTPSATTDGAVPGAPVLEASRRQPATITLSWTGSS